MIRCRALRSRVFVLTYHRTSCDQPAAVYSQHYTTGFMLNTDHLTWIISLTESKFPTQNNNKLFGRKEWQFFNGSLCGYVHFTIHNRVVLYFITDNDSSQHKNISTCLTVEMFHTYTKVFYLTCILHSIPTQILIKA